jgi:hypothetical protein
VIEDASAPLPAPPSGELAQPPRPEGLPNTGVSWPSRRTREHRPENAITTRHVRPGEGHINDYPECAPGSTLDQVIGWHGGAARSAASTTTSARTRAHGRDRLDGRADPNRTLGGGIRSSYRSGAAGDAAVPSGSSGCSNRPAPAAPAHSRAATTLPSAASVLATLAQLPGRGAVEVLRAALRR